MILDIIIIAVIIFMAVIGLKRGIAKTLYGIICLIVAGFLAYLGGRLIAEAIYNTFILNPITDSIKTSFGSATVNSSKLSSGVFSVIPGVLTGVLDSNGITQKGFALMLDSASVSTENAALNVVNDVISPVLISFISIGIIILLFIILLLLFKLVLGRYILKLFRLPVIKQINAVAGAVFGIIEGVVIVVLIIVLIKTGSTFSSSSFISKELIDSSSLFSTLYNWSFTGFLSDFTGK